jgi:hypothetical protein
MIRTLLGFLIVFGAVGGMEDPNNSLILLLGVACAGLFIMASGVKRINQDGEF